ncbi:Two pore potassium channel c [Vitis vinifera]|uniref:Two pore potassium channel c n=1 Tax=Vitis vinifera TaxID=29760 RepID=A0A438EI44_VITVI|nr:Two pore potassium channel c [Vitis vinifera]
MGLECLSSPPTSPTTSLKICLPPCLEEPGTFQSGKTCIPQGPWPNSHLIEPVFISAVKNGAPKWGLNPQPDLTNELPLHLLSQAIPLHRTSKASYQSSVFHVFPGKSEYVIYKLKELGKVSEKDISQICNKFDRLDSGNCGKITLADLMENHH